MQAENFKFQFLHVTKIFSDKRKDNRTVALEDLSLGVYLPSGTQRVRKIHSPQFDGLF